MVTKLLIDRKVNMLSGVDKGWVEQAVQGDVHDETIAIARSQGVACASQEQTWQTLPV